MPISMGQVFRNPDEPDEQIRLSVVIPAYNEERRLAGFLNRVCDYLPTTLGNGWEVIVVNDGSHDRTAELVQQFCESHSQVRLISHLQNCGKGEAVRTGILASRGELILYTDADGATPIEEERGLREAVESGCQIAAGSRLVASSQVRRKRGMIRAILGLCFSRMVKWIVPCDARDTQCGFKMLQRAAAHRLFNMSSQSGYLFDVEILHLARLLNYRVVECPVSWQEVPGSKVRIISDSIQMLMGLRDIRVASRRSVRRQQALPAFSHAPWNHSTQLAGALGQDLDCQ